MILLDTNIISEHLRPSPNPNVIAWIDAQPANEVYICTPVLAELRFGAERLSPGRKQMTCTLRSIGSRVVYIKGASYPSTPPPPPNTGGVAANRERMGRPMGQMDSLIAAIALVHGRQSLHVTIRDFAGLGFEVVNPFDPR